jgi:DNA primase
LAADGWRQLLTAAHATGVSAQQLETAGLIVKGKTSTYDRFRHRLMFPIVDVRGRVVGFGGRSLGGQEPKYLNSPETALYIKGRHLFGLAQAKDAIMRLKTAVVVEGYFDCVALAGGGLSHVVSPLGTALTEDQARLLKRYAETVVLAFDSDAAGEQATLRGIDLLVESGLHVRVAQMPAGMDPDEYLCRYGLQRLEQLLEQAQSIFDFLVQAATRRHRTDDVEGQVRVARFVLPTIARVPDAMLRREYVRLLAEQLRLDEGAVAEELAKVKPRTVLSGPPGGARASGVRASAPGAERLLTALVLDEPARWRQAEGRIWIDEVTDPSLRRILEVICELEAAGSRASPAHVVSRLAETEGLAALVSGLVELAQATAAKDEAFDDCLRRLRASTRRRELAALREQIRAAQGAGHETELQRLLTEYQQCLVGTGG